MEVQDLQPIEWQLIDHVIVFCKLIYVNPSTSATGERSFSTAKTNQEVASIKNVGYTFQPSLDFEHT